MPRQYTYTRTNPFDERTKQLDRIEAYLAKQQLFAGENEYEAWLGYDYISAIVPKLTLGGIDELAALHIKYTVTTTANA